MTIREAILKAADHIERHPDSYSFLPNTKPRCGSPGCMLGWIGVKAGVRKERGVCYTRTVAKFMRVKGGLYGFLERTRQWDIDRDGALGAADVMRAYADKYHPARRRAAV